MRRLLIILVLALLVGCGGRQCKTDADCVPRTCFDVECPDILCEYSPIADCCGNEECEPGEDYSSCNSDCPDCDDLNQCTQDSYDYHEQACVNKPILDVTCCGNGLCELGEDFLSCTRDCPNCDDANACTEDSYDYHEQRCVNEAITPCCGNAMCDDVETHSSCATDCPDCDDDDELTGDSFNYETQDCEYVTYQFYQDFDDGHSWTQDPGSYDPRWEVVDGMLGKVPAAEYCYSSFGSPSWTDYALIVGVKLEKGIVEMNVRASEDQSYAITVYEDKLTLEKDAKARTSLESANMTFEPDQVYEIRTEAKGNTIQVYVDGELILDHTDNNPISAGQAALYIDDTAYLDYVIVEASSGS